MKIEWKKIIISAVAVGLLGLVLTFLFKTLNFPHSWVSNEYFLSGTFRDPNMPLRQYVSTYPFMIGFSLALVYNFVHEAFKKNKNTLLKGMGFGFLMFLIVLPLLLLGWFTLSVSGNLVFSWIVLSFVQLTASGIAIVWIFDK